jgi:hypothetical protein
MRIALSADMEGISQISDPREVTAACPEYWTTGQQRMNDDVAAAAEGLIAGGATELIVLDNHESGNTNNLLPQALPDGARLESLNVFDLPDRDIAGMLQVGYHARAGIPGFLSHTYCGGLRLRVDDELISESHGRIWAARAPLLGIIGTDAHERTLGSLTGTPFLAVQQSTRRTECRPTYDDDARAGLDAIRAFAEACMRLHRDAPRPPAPARTTFRARLACQDEGRDRLRAAGWTAVGQSEYAVELAEWSDARAPLYAAMGAATLATKALRASLDLSSHEALLEQDQDRVRHAIDGFMAWATDDNEPEW